MLPVQAGVSKAAVSVKALIVVVSLLNGFVAAYADDVLTAEELLGRKIYRDGNDGSKNGITASLGQSGDKVLATIFACANCHGLEGEGKQEGGLNVPAISAPHLFTTDFSTSPQGRVYNAKTVIRAITQGIDDQNKPLSAAMPRYALSHDQAQALVAYLKHLGSANDVDAGITQTEVQLATLLPLTGPLAATGKNLQATLEACVAGLNSQGALYGRKLTLTTLDSGTTHQQLMASTKRLLFEVQPFALISGYFPEISTDIFELLDKEKLPVIAPLTFDPKVVSIPASSFFYFLPSYADQAQALLDYWREQISKSLPSASKLAVVYSDRASNVNVLRQLREHLQRYHLPAMAEVVMPQATEQYNLKQITMLMQVKPDAIFFLGNSKELAEFNKLLANTDQQPMLLGLLAMLGAEVINMPDLVMTKMLLASPFAFNDPGLPQFKTGLDNYSVNLQNPGLQRIACAAVNFVGDGLKRTGKHLSRAMFIQSLKGINSFPVDVMPPLDFGANNQQGIKGAYILTADMTSGTTSFSEWIPSSNK